jgi:transposase InsO family protein
VKLYANPISEGNQLARSDGHYTIVSISKETQDVILERHSDRVRILDKVHKLTGEIFRGQVTPYDEDGNRVGEPSFEQDIVGLEGFPRILFDMRAAYCQALLKLRVYGPKNLQFQHAVDEVHAELKRAHARDKHYSYIWADKYSYWTVYGWCRAVRKANGDLTALAYEHESARTTTQRLHPEVRKIIDAVLDEIEAEYLEYIDRSSRGEKLSAPEVSIRHIRTQVKAAIKQANLASGKSLCVPAFETIRQHKHRRNRLLELVAKHGPHVAKKELGPFGKSFAITRILQRAEIDFFHGDIILVADFFGIRVVLGIPYLTIIIDVFSRAILAVVVEFNVPDSRTVLTAIKRMLSPKTDVWENYPDIKTRAEYFGPPEVIAYDNAWVFDSLDLKSALSEFNILMAPCVIKTPYNKPHVEAFGKTINVKFHRLQSGHKKSIAESRLNEYDPLDFAAMELHEFQHKLYRYIYDSYSVSEHSGLFGLSPRNYWEHSLMRLTGAGEGSLFPLNKLEVDFKVSRRHMVPATRKGIVIDTREYRSPELTELFVTNPPKTKFDVREDPLDINRILVVDPSTRRPIVVPSAVEYPPELTSKGYSELRKSLSLMADIDDILVAETERGFRRDGLKPKEAAITLTKKELAIARALASPGATELLEKAKSALPHAEPQGGEDFDDLAKSVWGDDAEEDN